MVNTDNLGHKVSTREYPWDQMVKKVWGAEWNRPDWTYRFSNGRRFDSSDRGESGVYRR